MKLDFPKKGLSVGDEVQQYTGKTNHAFEYYYQQNYQWTNGVEMEILE